MDTYDSRRRIQRVIQQAARIQEMDQVRTAAVMSLSISNWTASGTEVTARSSLPSLQVELGLVILTTGGLALFVGPHHGEYGDIPVDASRSMENGNRTASPPAALAAGPPSELMQPLSYPEGLVARPVAEFQACPPSSTVAQASAYCLSNGAYSATRMSYSPIRSSSGISTDNMGMRHRRLDWASVPPSSPAYFGTMGFPMPHYSRPPFSAPPATCDGNHRCDLAHRQPMNVQADFHMVYTPPVAYQPEAYHVATAYAAQVSLQPPSLPTASSSNHSYAVSTLSVATTEAHHSGAARAVTTTLPHTTNGFVLPADRCEMTSGPERHTHTTTDSDLALVLNCNEQLPVHLNADTRRKPETDEPLRLLQREDREREACELLLQLKRSLE